jgi:cell division septal protein FtsQ
MTYLLGWSTLLAARSIVIDGTLRTDEISSQIINSSSSFHIGEPLARVDVHSIARRISHLDWVEGQSVKREWVHGRLHIVIQERTPIAQFASANGRLMLIDKNGKIFTAKGSARYPVITFATQADDLLLTAATFVQSLPADLLANLQSISIRSSDFIQSSHSEMGKGTLIIRWGNSVQLGTKVKVLRALLALPENAKAKMIDLSSPLSPIAK